MDIELNYNNDDQNCDVNEDGFAAVYQTLKDGDVLHMDFVERHIAIYGPCYNQMIAGVEADYDLVVLAAAKIIAERALGFRPDYAPPRRCYFDATGDKVFAADTPVYLSFIPEAVEFTAVMTAVSAETWHDTEEYDEDLDSV